jgi:hypothetical protein
LIRIHEHNWQEYCGIHDGQQGISDVGSPENQTKQSQNQQEHRHEGQRRHYPMRNRKPLQVF